MTTIALTTNRIGDAQNPNDPLSYLCAWLALVPQALCVIYVTLMLFTREIEILLMFAGQMGCEVLNFGLKRLIKQERPERRYLKIRIQDPFSLSPSSNDFLAPSYVCY